MSTYPATVDLPQQASIEHRWLLDEASGNRSDVVGGLTLVDGNTVGAGTGYSDLGANFDNAADYESGNSEYLRASNPGASIASGNQDFSFFVWIKLESQPATNSQMQIGNKYGTTDAERAWSFHYRDSSGTKLLRFDNQNGANGVTVSVTQTLSNATWYHVGITFDLSAGSVDFYVDGTQTGVTQTGLNTTVNASATADFTLGAIGDTPSQFFDGLQQDAMFWGGIKLTSSEISDELYNSYITAPATGLPTARAKIGVGM